METVKVRIFGKVQGVFFRKNTQNKARKLGITGTVKNNPDGSVEVLASGDRELLNRFLDWCKAGDPPAKVERVEVDRVDRKKFEDFKILQ